MIEFYIAQAHQLGMVVYDDESIPQLRERIRMRINGKRGSLAMLELLTARVDKRVRGRTFHEKQGSAVLVLKLRVGWYWFSRKARAAIREAYTKRLAGDLPVHIILKVKFRW